MEFDFDKAWNNATSSIIRLETLPVYTIPAEMARLEKYNRGLPYLDEELIAWKNRLNETAQRGVKIKRYRVIEEPISDYLEFEFDFWKKTINSQYVFVIDRKEYDVIVEKHSFDPNDCWIFDQKMVYRMNYSQNGIFLDGKFETDNNKVHQYQKIIEEIASRAVPLDKFLRR